MNKNRLELNWYGKNENIKVEPRILVEQKEFSNFEYDKTTQNILIHGDNLLSLKSLEQHYSSKINFIYIDPPYNTGSAFTSYDDNLEHSKWLSLMKPRLELLRRLLAEDGIIAVQIDNAPNDNTQKSPEFAYLLVMLDEIFGRRNYISTLIWKKKGNPGNTAKGIGTITESIAVYAKNKDLAKINRQKFNKTYKYKDDRGNYNLERFLKTDMGMYKRDTMKFAIVDPITKKEYLPPNNMRWTFGAESVKNHIENGLIVFDENYPVPMFKRYKKGEDTKLYNNLLLEHGSLRSAKNELAKLGFKREDFETPKPEILIRELMEMFSDEGDLVLDSFLGSGTTAAVAHKMNRNWIGIELGDHVYSHCIPRLNKVIANEDLGGITSLSKWNGGGGFRFFKLAPTLIMIDKFDQPIINEEYNAEMLASAIALHEGYIYEPSQNEYWKQSYSSKNSYLFVTTNHINHLYLESIESQMSKDEHLLIVTKSFTSNLDRKYKNINIKKIPESILNNCEYGINDYSFTTYESSNLNVESEGDNCD